MKKFNKILLSAVSVILVAALSVGTTLALLKDSDSDVNVMTVGNVKIEQIEQEWNSDKTALVDFTQAKPILPVVGAEAWENETTDGGAYRRFAFNNAVDKYVSVKNTGRWDAYVRTYIALEMGSLEYDGTANSEFGKTISASVNSASGAEFPGLHWIWTDDYVADIGGKKYNVMVAVYDEALAPNVTTIPSLLQVYMKNEATNETIEKLDGNGNGTFDILVFSQACQADGFNDPVAALNSVFGDSATTNPWGATLPEMPELVDTADELTDAIESGKSVVLTKDIDLGSEQIAVTGDVTINLNGNDITADFSEAGHYAMFTIPNGASLTIEGNGNVTADTEAIEDNRSLAIFYNTGKLTINGGTYTVNDSSEGRTWIIATIIDNRTNNSSCDAYVTINGGEFTVSGKAINLFRNYPQQGGKATMVFNDGKFNDKNGETAYIWNQEAGTNPGELYFNGGVYGNAVVYEDYNGQSDIHIAPGVVVNGYSGNN